MYSKKIIRIFVFIVLFSFLVYFLITYSKNQLKNENFNGVVKEINYDGHGNPRVRLDENNFINLLLFSFDDSPKSIMVGDSLNKKKGSSYLFHYKIENNEYFLYNKYSY